MYANLDGVATHTYAVWYSLQELQASPACDCTKQNRIKSSTRAMMQPRHTVNRRCMKLLSGKHGTCFTENSFFNKSEECTLK